MRPIHAGRLERWLGSEKITHLQRCMRGWYGRPICLVDVPGSVWITADGDFVGTFERGYYMNAVDAWRDWWQRLGRFEYGYVGAGFSSVGNALQRASQGFSQRRQITKVGGTGVVGVTNTLWRLGPQPAAGGAGAAAPGGTAHDDTNTGAVALRDAATDGQNRLVGADFSASVINNSLLLYDRLFSVAKTMNSTATEAVTGVPTRYQSTSNASEAYIGDNFGFIEVFTALPATAHNWTVCLYTDQAGASSTLPSVTGNSSAIIDRLDQPVQQWFVPLESGDTGIGAWTQMQCSALVATGAINFCVGHPIGFMSFPVINSMLPFDWLTNRDQAPAVFNNACIAFLEPLKPATGATTYTGRFQLTEGS